MFKNAAQFSTIARIPEYEVAIRVVADASLLQVCGTHSSRP